MSTVAIMTDSNSGITQEEASKLGVYVIPMPFIIKGTSYFEGINLTQEQFYGLLAEDEEISTSMPAMGNTMDMFDEILEEYDELVYIPMSSGLSGSTAAATLLAEDYGNRVQVVDNHRISVTQRQSVLDAIELRNKGMTAEEIKDYLEKVKAESSIYIMVDTMYYLKKGGRVTPAAASIATLLKIKPVLSINGEKLDLFGTARTLKTAKSMMIEQMKKDFAERFNSPDGKNMNLEIAYTKDLDIAEEFLAEVKEAFPNNEIVVQPLSLSVSCHIGPGSLALACSKKIG
ncbi:MAG: DegV family protein [Lachnospiraceae bacterium]|nr:DegV family protein [Lachnospiraceae bacterium]